MLEEGRFLGSATDGKLIPRKIDPAVLTRPAFYSLNKGSAMDDKLLSRKIDPSVLTRPAF